MADTPDNAASRIHDVLSRARQRPESHNVAQVWNAVLQLSLSEIDINKISEKTVVTVSSHLHLLYSTLGEIEQEMRHAFGGDADIYLKDFDKLKRALMPAGFNQQWQTRPTRTPHDPRHGRLLGASAGLVSVSN